MKHVRKIFFSTGKKNKIDFIFFSLRTVYFILALPSYVTSLKAQFTIEYILKIENDSDRCIYIYIYIHIHSVISLFFPFCALVHRTLFEFEVVRLCAWLFEITTHLIFYGLLLGRNLKLFVGNLKMFVQRQYDI